MRQVANLYWRQVTAREMLLGRRVFKEKRGKEPSLMCLPISSVSTAVL